VQFSEKDVVRHNLVQQIIRAYEEYEVPPGARSNPSENGKADAAGKKEESRG